MKTIQINSFVMSLILVLLVMTGCTTYLEEQTPAGTVPAVPKHIAAPTQEQSQAQTSGEPKASSTNPPKETEPSDIEETIELFSEAYVAQNRPRMAVFLNRELSDDVREWQTDIRAVVAGESHSETMREKQESITTKESKTGESLAAYIEKPTDTGERQLFVTEQWKWAFEDGFIQPFLRAKSKVVDRATVIRLAGAESQNGALRPIAVKQVEMEALKDHVDIFVEVLITRSTLSVYGYEFKATAKEVNTGIILANVTSLDWKASKRRGRVIIAGSDGYEITNTVSLPQVRDVASDLALDLMSDLVRTWGE